MQALTPLIRVRIVASASILYRTKNRKREGVGSYPKSRLLFKIRPLSKEGGGLLSHNGGVYLTDADLQLRSSGRAWEGNEQGILLQSERDSNKIREGFLYNEAPI